LWEKAYYPACNTTVKVPLTTFESNDEEGSMKIIIKGAVDILGGELCPQTGNFLFFCIPHKYGDKFIKFIEFNHDNLRFDFDNLAYLSISRLDGNRKKLFKLHSN